MRTRIAFALAFLLVAAAAGIGQVSGRTSSGPNGSFSAEMTITAPRFAGTPITGAPYSAEQVSERTQTLSDGTHISQKDQTVRLFRDSSGRTRMERPFYRGGQSPAVDLPLYIELSDPVGGFYYILDQENHVAHRSAFSAPAEPPPMQTFKVSPPSAVLATRANRISGNAAPDPGRPETSSEAVGTQMMEGVLAEGTVRKTTYPAGMFGNDRPIVAVWEQWYSPELRLQVMTKNSDPRSGENTMRLMNISRAEPDFSLFQPPPDYKVVDETGPFTLKFTRPGK